MRVLLDEHLPRLLANEIAGHEVKTVHQMGWDGLTNGALLSKTVESGFEVFVTADKSVEFQQNLANSPVGLVVLQARSNDLIDLTPLGPSPTAAIARIRPSEVLHVAV